jgi:hypothetical protein
MKKEVGSGVGSGSGSGSITQRWGSGSAPKCHGFPNTAYKYDFGSYGFFSFIWLSYSKHSLWRLSPIMLCFIDQ